MDELDLIVRFPGGGDTTDVAEDEVKARARVRVMRTISASEVDRRHSRPQVRRSPSGRILKLGIAAAVGAVVVALILPVAFMERPASSASAALLRLAESARANSGWESPTHDQFIYIRSTGESPVCDDGSCGLQSFDRESWIAPDGSGRILESVDGHDSDESFGPGQLSFWELYETLGWSQERMRRHLEGLAGVEHPDDFAVFVVVSQLLAEQPSTPEIRAKLFELAASLSGVELLGTTTDQLGRLGIGIAYSSRGLRFEVVFDESTALLLEVRVTETDEDAELIPIDVVPGGWLVAGSRSTYESSRLVASTDSRAPLSA
jgi:hypothetical protein